MGLLFVDLVVGEDIKNKGYPLIHGLSPAGSRMVPSGAQIFFDLLVNSLFAHLKGDTVLGRIEKVA